MLAGGGDALGLGSVAAHTVTVFGAFLDTGSVPVNDPLAVLVAGGLNVLSPGIVARTSAKNILYTVVNSRAYEAENLNPGMAKWKIVLIGADVVAALLIVGLEYTAIKNYKKRKEEEEEV